MKDYKKILTIAAILCMSLIGGSCSQGDNGEEPGPTPPKEEKTGFLSLRLDTGTPTATRMDDDTEIGDSGESIVEKLWVLLYSKTGNTDNDILMYAFDLDAANGSAPSTSPFWGNDVVNADMMSGNHNSEYADPTDYSFVSVAREVAVQEYQLIVIANPGATFENKLTQFSNSGTGELATSDAFYSLKTLLTTANGGDTEIAYTDLVQYPSPMGPYGFFMSNANGPVPVAESDIKESAHTAQLNPKAINLDRAVAKVIVNAKNDAQGVTLTNGGRMLDFKWTLENINKHSYLIRQYGLLSGGWAETYEYSILADRKDIYATDPNFGAVSTLDWAANFYNDYEIDYSSNEQDGLQDWNEWDDMRLEVVERKWKYVPENTMSQDAQNDPTAKSYTTQVVARVIIRYPMLYLLEGNDHYYSFDVNYKEPWEGKKWIVFSHSQAISWIKNDSFPYPSLRNVLGYVDQNSGTFMGTDPDQSSFFSMSGENTPKPDENWELQNLYKGTEYIGGTEYMTYVVSDDNKLVWFHPNGLNVYRLPIVHFGTGSMPVGETDYGYYGVVRNNVYRIWIDSIDGPGNPVAGYISADIHVNGWYSRSQEEDI